MENEKTLDKKYGKKPFPEVKRFNKDDIRFDVSVEQYHFDCNFHNFPVSLVDYRKKKENKEILNEGEMKETLNLYYNGVMVSDFIGRNVEGKITSTHLRGWEQKEKNHELEGPFKKYILNTLSPKPRKLLEDALAQIENQGE